MGQVHSPDTHLKAEGLQTLTQVWGFHRSACYIMWAFLPTTELQMAKTFYTKKG